MSGAAEHVLSLLRRLDAARDAGERERLAEALMAAVYGFGLALHRGEESARELAAAAEPLVQRATGPLGLFAGSIEERFVLAWEPNGWEEIAWRRSALAFLLELFPDEADWLRDQIGPDAYDDVIRRRSHDFGHLRPSEIPPGMPRSHWWWWAPDEPEA